MALKKNCMILKEIKKQGSHLRQKKHEILINLCTNVATKCVLCSHKNTKYVRLSHGDISTKQCTKQILPFD